MLYLAEIRRHSEGLSFDQSFDLASELKARNPEILDVTDIRAQGKARYEEGLYFLEYDLSYTITLASSRSLLPVLIQEEYPVQEIFMEEDGDHQKEEWIEDDLILILDGNRINLGESVGDNILLNVPMKVLTPEEEAGEGMLEGQSWTVLSEEEYERMQEEKKEAASPFAGLSGLFDE